MFKAFCYWSILEVSVIHVDDVWLLMKNKFMVSDRLLRFLTSKEMSSALLFHTEDLSCARLL